MTPYEILLQEGFVHNVMLVGNRREMQRRIRDIVHGTERRLEQSLINQASLLSGADVTRIRRGVFRGSARLEELASRLDNFVGEVSDVIRQETLDAARDLAAYEAAFWQDRYRQLTVDTPELAPIINTESAFVRDARTNVSRLPLVAGTIAAGIATYRRNRRERLRRGITAASQTEGLPGILGFLLVTPAQRRRGRIIGETTRNINVATGDVHTHAAAIGAKTFADTNPRFDLVWTSIIDERTSSICLTRNGQFVNRDLDGLLPPAHINCRSIAVPLILSERLTDAQRGRLRRDTRRAIERGLPNFNSTQDSFSQLSEARQRQLLGAQRLRIVQERGLSVRDLIGDDESFISLEELAQREGLDLSDIRRAA